MKLSARNVFRCSVATIVEGAVNSEVVMTLTDGQTLSAIITKKSVHSLGLSLKSEVLAIIKSSLVILTTEDPGLRTSARNRLCGTVSAIEKGAVNSEVALDLGSDVILTAIITNESLDSLGFSVGDRACALVKASHIILAVE